MKVGINIRKKLAIETHKLICDCKDELKYCRACGSYYCPKRHKELNWGKDIQEEDYIH